MNRGRPITNAQTRCNSVLQDVVRATVRFSFVHMTMLLYETHRFVRTIVYDMEHSKKSQEYDNSKYFLSIMP
jgi:hypothetical protein